MIKVYCSEELKQAIADYAESQGISASAWLKRLAMAELSRRKKLVSRLGERWVMIRDK